MADAHRFLSQTFLQIMLDRRYLPLSDFRALVHALNQKYDYDLSLDHDADLLEFINKLNPTLTSLHLKLSQSIDEEKGHRVLVLCNTLSSELSRNPTFNDQQMALFRQIVTAIVESVDGILDLEQAESAVVDIPNCTLSAQQAKNTVQQLIKQKYLRCSNDVVTLTPSALSELQPYIAATMPDQVSNCFGCNSLCLQGERCPGSQCKGRVHKHCAPTVFQRKKACRLCKGPWGSEVFSQ
ncbi:non-structural maintenance of chromosomes element 1 homolog [Galendromus occidentalis]|uniref:Non-structural maintenance of chromosomes element 1 homolog n=1 Tax=Galendromus occidentalis TaxID=34638 RepID=A0AAJ6QRR2_9ACAR|nr:non-structural maintenance of chromosomes element 1 homolog [Galendromus occidentalis]